MANDWYTLAELALQLGRDRREIEKLVQRGRIPGHRVAGEWRFHTIEITHWLEKEIRQFNGEQLEQVESSYADPAIGKPVTIRSLLKPELVAVPLEARTRRSVLETLIEVAGRSFEVFNPAAVLTAVLEREDVLSTGFENGVAIPHPRNPLPDALGDSLIAYGRTFSDIPFGAPRRQLSDIFFLVTCRDAKTHLAVLARLGRLIQADGFLESLRCSDDAVSSHQVIIQADQQVDSRPGDG
jgi:PTS system nitrogen regulatory IIA component